MIKKYVFKIILVYLFINIFSGSLYGMEPKDIRRFRIENLEGKLFDSRKALGEAFVISFFFTRCPPCWKEMLQLFAYMKKENRLHQLMFVDSYVDMVGIEVQDEPDTERVIKDFIKKYKISPANVYFDDFGSLLKGFIKAGAFPKAKAAKTKIVWPTILVISASGKLVKSIEGSRSDFLQIIEDYL